MKANAPDPGSDRLDRLVDVVAAGLITIFTFALPLPEAGLGGRALVFQLSSWFVFVLNVGVLWFLQRESSRHRGRPASSADLLLHLPIVASMLLLTIPARRIAILEEYAAGPERRSEFLGALGWYAALLGFGIFANAWLQLDPSPGETPAGRSARFSRLRLHLGASILCAATALALPRFGGKALLPWFLFPAWYGWERLRLLTLWPELEEGAKPQPVAVEAAPSPPTESSAAPSEILDEDVAAPSAGAGEPPVSPTDEP